MSSPSWIRMLRSEPRAGTDTGPAFWAAYIAAFAAIGVLRFSYFFVDDVMDGESWMLGERALLEGSGAITAGLAATTMVWLWKRAPVDRERWRTTIGLHLGGAILFALLHTSLMWGVRLLLYPVFGFGEYHYGPMPLPYLMEFPNQLLFYMTFIAAFSALRHWRLLRARELRTASLERDLARAELETMRLRLQPHFLFNALNTISATMYEDVERADAMLEQLATLLRHALASEHDDEVPLGDELAVVGAYMALIEARFGDGVRFRAEIEPECRHAAVPSLLIQPLVENAVRHGNPSRTGRGEIILSARRTGDRLTITVEDDGPGVPEGREVLSSGNGLTLTARRLQLMFGADHRISAGNRAGGGFRVGIELPLRMSGLPRRLPDDTLTVHATAAGR